MTRPRPAGSALATVAAILAAGDGAPAPVPRQLDAAGWDAVLAVAGPRDLMPALWRPARTLGLVEPVPEPLVEGLGDQAAPRHHPAAVLELAHRRNAARTQDLLDQLEMVVADFAGRGIEVVALKGAAHLVGGTWPDPAARAMSDLDLLIDPGAARAARAGLERLGYQSSAHPGEVAGGHHHLPPLRHPRRFGSIELHVEPLQRGWRAALDATDLWADASVVNWRGHRIGVPSGVDTAVISLVHGYLADLARYQAQIPLRTVHELWRFDRRSGPVDWREVRLRLEVLGWASLVDDHRITVDVLFGDPVAPGQPEGTPLAWSAARARLALALVLDQRGPLARAADPWLRARSSLDEGRLRRHYGTAIEGRWRLRLHHLSRQLPGRRAVAPAEPEVLSSAGSRRRPRALLITPELPDTTGNGLAMRAEVALRALTAVADVTVVVIGRPRPATSPGLAATVRRPPMGTPADRERARVEAEVESRVERLIVHRPAPVEDRVAARSWLADDGSRARLAALEPLSEPGRLAHPDAVAALASELTGGADHAGGRFELVHVVRVRMAPWAEPFAFADGVTTILDLDDDEVATHTRLAATARQHGEPDLADHLAGEGESLGRLADWYAPRAPVVTVASPDDVAGVSRHAPRRVEVVPNAVGVGHDDLRRRWSHRGDRAGRAELADRRGDVRLLLVGNFTYAPNRWAAETLVDQIRPALAARLDQAIHVELVGAAPTSFDRFRSIPGVQVAGHVAPPDLRDAYDRASLVVLPLPPAGGTRIKVLEAFVLQVPVVATPGAVEGLGVVDGVHALVADDADGLVDAGARALADPAATTARVERARQLAVGFDRARVARQLAGSLLDWSGLGTHPGAASGVSPGSANR